MELNPWEVFSLLKQIIDFPKHPSKVTSSFDLLQDDRRGAGVAVPPLCSRVGVCALPLQRALGVLSFSTGWVQGVGCH